MTVEFHPLGKSTEVVITHEGLPDDQMVNFHAYGWQAGLDALERML